MKLLVIGGGRFVGRHIVAAALARGDAVTLFNRGRSAPPPGVRQVTGDRRGDLTALAAAVEAGTDAVIDCCGYLPSEVARMAALLEGRVGCYAFVSSVSVYAGFARPNDESSPLGTIDDPDTEVIDGRTYGPLKALCEAEVRRRFGDRALLLRPGLVVGPHDPTGRFTYWPARVADAADGEAVLAPGTPDDPLQFIDARDFAAFTLQAIARGIAGAYNVVTPPGAHTIGGLLAACAAAAGTRPRWAWLDADRIAAAGLAPWADLPAWLPPRGDEAAFAATDDRAARAAGLVTRPLAATVADTLAWLQALPPQARAAAVAGLARERERQALAASGDPPPQGP